MMQIRKESVKNMQEYKMPPCDVTEENIIGSGGNGKVGIVPNCKRGTVIKIFSIDENLGKSKREKRYRRFCKEIRVQRELNDTIKGVLPVYDFSFPEEYSKEEPAWYTMPRAEKFEVWDGLSLMEKLQNLLQLANILKELQEKGIAHRDIKPENILVYEGQICLADYGLIWVDGEETITYATERLGPTRIMPRELEDRREIKNCDYTKSDVYLFSKVLWMYLKEDNHGFKGEYSRNDPQIYLKLKETKGKTIEPLHILLEKATVDSWSKRPKIDECIERIIHQLLILKGDFPEEYERKYIIGEKLKFYRINEKSDYEVYETSGKISKFMKNMRELMKFQLYYNGTIYNLQPYTIKEKSDNFFILSQEEFDGSIRKYAVHINRLEISDANIKVHIGRVNVQERNIAISLNAEVIDDECVGEIILE